MTLIRFAGAALLALCVVVTAQDARAQQPSAAAIATAKQIMEIKEADKLFKPMMLGVIERTRTVLQQSNLNLSKELQDVSMQIAKDTAPAYNEVNEQVARAYAQAFTEQELKDLLAFYSSPLGRKSIVTEPKVFQLSMAFMERWSTAFSDDVMAMFRKEMKKRGHDI